MKTPNKGRRAVTGRKATVRRGRSVANGPPRQLETNGHSERERRYSDLQRALAVARDALKNAPLVLTNGDSAIVVSKQLAYQEMVARLRQLVADILPTTATVLVISKGDSELLKLGGRAAWHFPSVESGAYAGHHPPDSVTAIAHLEELRAKGAEFLLIPATAFWWLEFYGDFRLHLERFYSLALREPQMGYLFDLRNRKAENHCQVEPIPPAPATQSLFFGGAALFAELPSENDLRIELSQALGLLGKNDEAHALLLEAIQHEPSSPKVLLELSRREHVIGNQMAAARYAAEALAHAPEDDDLCFELARLAWECGRLDDVERLLMQLVERCPTNERVLNELLRFYCVHLENQANRADHALISRFLALLANPIVMRGAQPETHLRVAETLGSVGEIVPALSSLKAALRTLDFSSSSLQDFVLRFLRPAVCDHALVPFGDRRALAAFLTHLGNGFASVQDSFKARACYQLSATASSEQFASVLNLAFASMAEGAPLTALDHFSKVSRVYADDAAQVLWPTQAGSAWPHGAFDLSAGFESLKPPAAAWPKITVITPSYNQARYVEETILSVLNQNYPNLEYLVVDGASTDGSVEILRRYEARLSRLIVEPDEGQTDAINKGLRLSTGELLIWTNSDDMLAPGALYMLALAYLVDQADVIAGICLEHTERRFGLINLPAVSQATFNPSCLGEIFEYWLKGHFFYQPEVAFSRRILDKVGGTLDKSLYYTMDYDFWLRCAKEHGRVSVIHWPVGLFRRHPAQKTTNLDHTIIEQGTVRDRYVVPRPSFERTLDIRQRLAQAFARPMPNISVISTRASKIFSPDTTRELRETFATEGLNVTFYDSVDEQSVANADLVILLVHIYKERFALRKLREQGCKVPVVGWFWDNHHHVFENERAAADLDVCIPGHAFASSYLRTGDHITAPPVPLCVTQWSAEEAAEYFARHGDRERSNDLYGGFVRYSMAEKRNHLIDKLIAHGMSGVYFLEENALQRYFGMSLESRFEVWASHKVSLCLPLDGDLSQRLFDALLTGQVPIVPSDVFDLDAVIPPDIQKELPIIRFNEYSVSAVTDAHAKAIKKFDAMGNRGICRRHLFSVGAHMFSKRLREILLKSRRA